MHRLVRPIAAVLIAALAVPAFPQRNQQQPPQETDISKLTEVMDVRVINVDVVVTDKKGNVITGLKKDDFEIYENGVPKPITNFYEVEGARALNVEVTETTPEAAPAATPAPAPAAAEEIPENLRRRIIFYIDNLSLAPFNRNRVFAQMKEFIKNVMRPGDEAMIATFNRSMKIRVPFTRDVTQLQQTLDVIAGESALGLANKSERKQVEDRIREARGYSDAISYARSYASSVEHDLRQSASSLNALMSTLAGLEGKKILVLTSEGFPMQPGREAFQFIEEMTRERRWNEGSTLLEGMTFDASQVIQSISRTANANAITIYPIHAGGMAAENEMSAENARPTPFSVSQVAVQNSTDSMAMIAADTGGIASLRTSNFEAAFKKINRDLDSYYSLGYRAGTERVDRQRRLDVKVKNKNYYVRSRRSFVEKSVYGEMSDKVVANLLYKTRANDLKILVRIGTPVPSEDRLFRVPVEVQIPMESLTLLPQGDAGDWFGGFDVYVAVADKHNDMSDVARKSHQVRVPAAEYEKIKGKYYTYTLELLMEKGLNRVSIGVVDTVSNTSGFAREQILAQDLR